MAFPLNAREFELGKELLAKTLKKVEITVRGCQVIFTQYFELPTEEAAKSLARSLKETFTGEQ